MVTPGRLEVCQAEVPRPMLMDGRKMMIRAYDALA